MCPSQKVKKTLQIRGHSTDVTKEHSEGEVLPDLKEQMLPVPFPYILASLHYYHS